MSSTGLKLRAMFTHFAQASLRGRNFVPADYGGTWYVGAAPRRAGARRDWSLFADSEKSSCWEGMHLLFKSFPGGRFWLKLYIVDMFLPEAALMYARANEQEEREAMAEHDFDSPRSTNRLTAKQQGLLFS